MTLALFTQKFADCFHQTDPALIQPSTHFRQLEEWGSMMALIVIAMVDSDCGKTLSAEDLRAAQTVQQLFEIVQQK